MIASPVSYGLVIGPILPLLQAKRVKREYGDGLPNYLDGSTAQQSP